MPANCRRAVFIGRIKDDLGFTGSLIENPITGERSIVYEPEVWWQREQHLTTLESLGQRERRLSHGKPWELVYGDPDSD